MAIIVVVSDCRQSCDKLVNNMLISFSICLLGLVPLCRASSNDCPSKCQVAASQVEVQTYMELLSQSLAYASEWRADCSTCTERRESYRVAATSYLLGIFPEDPFKQPTSDKDYQLPQWQTCPTWNELEATYKRLEALLCSMRKYLNSLQSTCIPAKCQIYSGLYWNDYERFLYGVYILLQTLDSEMCYQAKCDPNLARKYNQEQSCKLSCNKFDIVQHWLQVAKMETERTIEIFGSTRPTDCDECCEVRQAWVYASLSHFVVADELIHRFTSTGFPDEARKSSRQRLFRKNRCSRLADWESMYVYISTAPLIVDVVSKGFCSLSICNNGSAEIDYLFELMSETIFSIRLDMGWYADDLCGEQGRGRRLRSQYRSS